MAKIFHIMDEHDESGYDYNERGYGQRDYEHHEDKDKMLEKAFREGCEHGYKKAMRDLEAYEERRERMGSGSKINYKEGFEEKIEKLKEKYK